MTLHSRRSGSPENGSGRVVSRTVSTAGRCDYDLADGHPEDLDEGSWSWGRDGWWSGVGYTKIFRGRVRSGGGTSDPEVRTVEGGRETEYLRVS